MTCYGCFSSRAEVVALRVGGTWGNTQIARIDLCDRCRLGVWTNWSMRK